MTHGLIVLAIVMLVVGILLCAWIIVSMAMLLLKPQRMTDARAVFELHRLSPGDLGLPFVDQRFQIIDQQTGGKLNIGGWWIPCPGAQGRCAVLIHGYSDAKVGAIAWAPVLRSIGWNILAIDLRAHGDSGGKLSTAGFWERHDVSQVIDQIRAQRPDETSKVILFGISLGAAVAAAAAALRDDLCAVVLECPFSDYRQAVMHHAECTGAPGPRFQQAAMRLAEKISGADFNAVRPIDLIGQIPCPLLIIHAGDDPYMSQEDFAAMQAAVEARPAERGPSIFWHIPDAHHVVGICSDPELYRRKLEEFLSVACCENSAK